MKKTILWPLVAACSVLLLAGCGNGSAPQSSTLSQPEPQQETPAPSVPSFLDEETLSEEEQFYVTIAKSLYVTGVHPETGGQWTENEKAGIFYWVIARDVYEDTVSRWYIPSAERYEIPLADIEAILFRHLDIDSFHPLEAFGDLTKYDAERQVLFQTMIRGYGGAAALEVLDIAHTGDTLTVELGVFDMEKFYDSSAPEYVLQGTYTVQFAGGTSPEEFKILYIQ